MENTKNNSSSTSGKSEKITSGQPQGKGSKLKRAFSMSRNPFHSVSRQTGKKAVEKSGTGTPAAAAATMTNASVVTSEQNSINSGGGGGREGRGGGNGTDPKVQGNSEAKSGSEKKIFRRLSVKKFINRIAQQMTYVNLAVSGSSAFNFFYFLDCFCAVTCGRGLGRWSCGYREKPERNEMEMYEALVGLICNWRRGWIRRILVAEGPGHAFSLRAPSEWIIIIIIHI